MNRKGFLATITATLLWPFYAIADRFRPKMHRDFEPDVTMEEWMQAIKWTANNADIFQGAVGRMNIHSFPLIGKDGKHRASAPVIFLSGGKRVTVVMHVEVCEAPSISEAPWTKEEWDSHNAYWQEREKLYAAYAAKPPAA